MRILGISAFYHDSAAALIDDGRIIAAAQEERFTRKKHDAGFPDHAIEYCLTEAGIGLHDIDFVVFYDKPFLKFERLLETYLAFAPKGIQFLSDRDADLDKREAVPEKSAEKGIPAPERRFRLGQQVAVLGASPEPRGQRVLPLAVRGSPGADDGWRRRMDDHIGCHWSGQGAADLQGAVFSPLVGPAVFGDHLLHRVQGQFGRVQGHGPGALRRARIQGPDARRSWST